MSDNLIPKWPDKDIIRETDAKQKQVFYYNKRNGVRDLFVLNRGDKVLIKLDRERVCSTPRVVKGYSGTPRSYVVDTPEGRQFRHNRRHLLRTLQSDMCTETRGQESVGSSD